MREEQKELYFFTKDHYTDELKRISPDCVAPIIAVRQVVRAAIYSYVASYCSAGTNAEEVFSQEDFQEVSNRIYEDIIQTVER